MRLTPLMLALVMFLTGCIKLDFHLKINDNGSGVLRQTMKLDFDPSMFNEFKGEGEEGPVVNMNPLKDMASEIEKMGGKLIKQTDTEVVAEYPFRRIEDLDMAKLMDQKGQSQVEWVNTHKNYLFFADHQLKLGLDLGELKDGEASGSEDEMANKFAKMFVDGLIDLTLRVTLPATPAHHNADEDYGQTLVWNLEPGKRTQAEVSYRTVNWPLIAGASAFGGVLAGSLGTMLIQGLTAKPATAR